MRIFNYQAQIPPDDGGSITFKWHWPRGTFEPYMSAYELSTFILPHMPSIVPLLGDNPRIQKEFETMLIMLATSPRKVIDQLLPWIRSVVKTEEDDILLMQIDCQVPQEAPKYFT